MENQQEFLPFNDGTRYEEVRKHYEDFHRKHPQVWVLFCRFTRERYADGFRHYSARGIFDRIRWETDQADVDGNSTFKINNNYSPFYSRRFMGLNPDFEGFFRTREQITQTKTATGLPELGPRDLGDVR